MQYLVVFLSSKSCVLHALQSHLFWLAAKDLLGLNTSRIFSLQCFDGYLFIVESLNCGHNFIFHYFSTETMLFFCLKKVNKGFVMIIKMIV